MGETNEMEEQQQRHQHRATRKRRPSSCRAARCLSLMVPFSLMVSHPTEAFQSSIPSPPRWGQISTCPPSHHEAAASSAMPGVAVGKRGGTRHFSIASDGLSWGLDDAWRFAYNDQPWRSGLPSTTVVAGAGRRGIKEVSIAPVIRELWKSTREESQVMQALILRAQSEPLEMLHILLSNPYGCNYVNVCTVLHRCARLGDSVQPKVRAAVKTQLLPIFRTVMPDCQARQLCNVAWALAKLRLVEEEGGGAVFESIITRLEDPEVLDTCNAGELAMAVWSVVASGHACKYADFLRQAAEPIAEKAHLLKPRDIGLITWAYATAFTHDWKDEVAAAAAAEEEEDMENPDAVGMKWLVRPVQALLERTLRCEDQLKPKDIAMMAWAYGRLCPVDWNTLGPQVDMVCAVLSSSALKCIKQFKARDLAELAVGVVHMQYDNANLMQLIAYEATRKLRHFSHRELSNLIWAYGKVFRRPRKFVLAAVEEARSRLPFFNPQELANLAWALTVLEVYDVKLMGEVFSLVQRRGDQLDEGDLNQLYQVYSMLRLQAPDAVETVGPRLLREMVRTWSRSKEKAKRTTDRQEAVSKVLRSLNIGHVLEADHDIDILLRDLPIAVEVDGPAHFLRNTGHPMGHTVMKRRILERLGYSVVSVPHYEWDRIPHWSSMELKRYLQRKCAIADVLHFSSQDFSSLNAFPRFGKKNRFD